MQNNALLRWYASKLDSHPLRTKIITSAAIAGTGDLLCQSFGLGSENTAEDTNDDRKHLHDHHHSKQHSHSAHSTSTNRYDITRTAKFALLGAALVAPATHFWYGYLMTKIPGSNMSSVGKRLAFDQGLFAPLLLPLPHFCHSSSQLENRTSENIPNYDHEHMCCHGPRRWRSFVMSSNVSRWKSEVTGSRTTDIRFDCVTKANERPPYLGSR